MTMTATTSHHDAAVDLVLSMTTQQFEDAVNADTRDRAPAQISAALRDPRVVKQWYLTVLKMHKSIEGQFAAKSAEQSAKIKKLHASGAPRAVILNEEASFDTWRAGALRVKTGLEQRLIEARGVIEATGDGFIQARITEERNQALGRVQVLEEAIRKHKTTVLGEDYDPSEADEILWSYA